MYFSLPLILSLFFPSSSGAAQLPFQHIDEYGYKGPGVYRIFSVDSNLPIGLDNSGTGPGVVSVTENDNDYTQRWLIASASANEVLLTNDATGAYIKSNGDDNNVTAKITAPYYLEVRWKIDTQYISRDKAPVGFNSTAQANHVLDLYGHRKFPGNQIITYTFKGDDKNNQLWYLQHLDNTPPTVKTEKDCVAPWLLDL